MAASTPKLKGGTTAQITAVNSLLSRGFSTPTFTVGAEAGNAIAVTVQLYDAKGTAVAAKTVVDVWISDTAEAAPTGTAPNGTVSITAGVELKDVTAKVLKKVLTTAAGLFTISIGESTAKSFYLNVAKGDVTASQIVTFA